LIEKLPALNSRAAIGLALALLFASVFFLPYLVPVTPSVSASYVAGYNNRAAVLIFAFGSTAFALLTRKRFPPPDPENRPLGLIPLILGECVTLTFCSLRLFPIRQHQIGGEACYAINRVQMLAAGFRPYTSFEWVYGPAHLYVPILLAHLAHGSVVNGYYLWWFSQWLIGTAMLWATLHLLDLPLLHRKTIFVCALLTLLPGIKEEGAGYTPTRTIGSAFFIVLVAYLRTRTENSTIISIASLLCVLAAFAISPEQGIAVLVGLLLWFALLTFQKPRQFSLGALITFLTGGAVITSLCLGLGEFKTLVALSQGGYWLPLLPSPTNMVILAAYVAATCAALTVLHARRVESVAVPLFFTGFALLPAAMGRCDFGHLLLAAPAVLLGIAAIDSRAVLRRVWSPLAFLFIVCLGPVLGFAAWMQSRVTTPNAATVLQQNPAVLLYTPPPGPEIYRSIEVVPQLTQTNTQARLDTGFFYRTTNAGNAESIEVLLKELDRTPLQPLVFIDAPLGDQLIPRDANLLNALGVLEVSPWLPRARNSPLTYQALIDFVQQNYRPSSTPFHGFRIWYPKAEPPT
jgi:hypothetical protein